MQIGGDWYVQKNASLKTPYTASSMHNALATIQYHFVPKFAMVMRGEWFRDPDAIVSNIVTDKAGKSSGYKSWGVTSGFEFKPTGTSYIRIEGRYLQMAEGQNIFYYNGENRNCRFEMMVNFGVTFDLLNTVLTRKSNP